MIPEAARDYPSRALSDEALAWIVRLHSGEAGEGDRLAFRQWRAQSSEHEAAACEAEGLWGDASGLEHDLSTGLTRPGGRAQGPSRRAILTGLAVTAVGAGAAVSWDVPGRLLSDYSTGLGETRPVELPDGSHALLNARSSIDVKFDQTRRQVMMRSGQVFFNVAADPARPFTVKSRDAEITALGTAFDVDAGLPHNAVAVAVTRHSVRIRSASGLHIDLAEGQRIVVAKDGSLGKVVAEDPSIALAWQSGMYIAEARPLEEVATALGRYAGGWIVIADDAIRSLPVSAVLDLRAPQASLDTLASGLPIRLRRISRFLVVISAA